MEHDESVEQLPVKSFFKEAGAVGLSLRAPCVLPHRGRGGGPGQPARAGHRRAAHRRRRHRL